MFNSLNFWKRNIVLFFVFLISIFPANAQNKEEEQNIEVVFVLDTTGSMASLIDGAKRKIWSIANTIIDVNPNANIRMGLVAYRDRGDDYITKNYDLSKDIQGFYGELIKLEADGGGDIPESVNEALDEAVRKLKWSKDKNTKRIIFLVGDAPPHMDYPNSPLYPDVLRRANADNIIVNTIQAGDDPDTKKIWQEIAQFGHGRYMSIPQDGGQIVVIETPYDNDIIIIQKQIDKTILPYGIPSKRAEVEEKVQTKMQASESVQLDSSRYYSKKSGAKEVITGGGDLITDMKSNKQDIETIKDADLPETLRGKTNDEKQKIIEQTAQKRHGLENQMSDLIAKRDAYIAEQAKKTEAKGDSFDSAVESTLREQLK